MDSRVRLIVNIGLAVLIMALAILAARSVGNFASQKIEERIPYTVTKQTIVNTKSTVVEEDDSLNMLVYNRNMFNMKDVDVDEDPVVEPIIEDVPEIIQEVAGDGKRPILTDLRVLLKGTQVASDPRYSVAMFMPLEGTNVRMQYLKEGDKLLDEATILRIVRNRVYFNRFSQNDRLEYIDTRTTENDLNEAKKVNDKLKVAEAKPAAETKPSTKTATANLTDVIKKVSADTYEVPRATLEQIRNNPNILKDPKYGAMPRITPVYKNGVVNGFRVNGVETSSIYGQLGIKSGDTILDINGQQVDNPQKAMAFFDNLEPGQNITLKLNRGGFEKTLTFQLK